MRAGTAFTVLHEKTKEQIANLVKIKYYKYRCDHKIKIMDHLKRFHNYTSLIIL